MGKPVVLKILVQCAGNPEQLFEHVCESNLAILPHLGGARLPASLVNLVLEGKLVDKQAGQDEQDCFLPVTKIAKITTIAKTAPQNNCSEFPAQCTSTKLCPVLVR